MDPGTPKGPGRSEYGARGTEAEAQLLAATPLEKRPGRPSNLSRVALFLASPASAWMTGEILTVSGGLRRESSAVGSRPVQEAERQSIRPELTQHEDQSLSPRTPAESATPPLPG